MVTPLAQMLLIFEGLAIMYGLMLSQIGETTYMVSVGYDILTNFMIIALPFAFQVAFLYYQMWEVEIDQSPDKLRIYGSPSY